MGGSGKYSSSTENLYLYWCVLMVHTSIMNFGIIFSSAFHLKFITMDDHSAPRQPPKRKKEKKPRGAPTGARKKNNLFHYDTIRKW